MGRDKVRRVSIPIPAHVAPELWRRAAQCQLSPAAWIVELVETQLAADRCEHGAPAPEPARLADRPEDAPDD
jgi:hypothetical protein